MWTLCRAYSRPVIFALSRTPYSRQVSANKAIHNYASIFLALAVISSWYNALYI